MLNPKLHQDLADDMLGLLFQGAQVVVEGQHGRDDHAAILSRLVQIPQMNLAERHFPGHQHHLPAFLQAKLRDLSPVTAS